MELFNGGEIELARPKGLSYSKLVDDWADLHLHLPNSIRRSLSAESPLLKG